MSEGGGKWVEDDGLVTHQGYGYWAFHGEWRDFDRWTDAQLVVLEDAARMLEKYMNDNWPEEGTA